LCLCALSNQKLQYQSADVDIEVRKHYAQPLASETGELPDVQSVQNRAWLICHEHGLKTGAKEGVAGYVEAAMEAFVKEALLNVYQRTRLNGPNLLAKASYKRMLDAQEAEAVQAKRARTAGGLLPIEQVAASQRAPLSLIDFRFSLRLGDPYLTRMPILAGWLMHDIASHNDNNANNLGSEGAVDERVNGAGRGDGHDAYRQGTAAAVDRSSGSTAATGAVAKRGAGAAAGPAAAAAATSVRRGGVGASHPNNHPGQDPRLSTAGDNSSAWGWRGAGPADVARLDSILDDCLAFGGGSGGAGF
jgi:transcriptional coactivator HFI1/ADA1